MTDESLKLYFVLNIWSRDEGLFPRAWGAENLGEIFELFPDPRLDERIKYRFQTNVTCSIEHKNVVTFVAISIFS